MHNPPTTEPKSKTATQQAGAFFGGGAMPFFQAKLTVNQPGDAYEQEADHIADKVMRMREGDAPVVQRMLAPAIQRACAHCEEKRREEEGVQRKETGGSDAGGQAAPSIVSDVLSSGGGQTMDANTQDFMGNRMGTDFSNVRIHTDGKAAESASAIQARAYTSGNNIVFGQGEYQPGTEEGKRLLAHELVHVGQQGGVQRMVQRQKVPHKTLYLGLNQVATNESRSLKSTSRRGEVISIINEGVTPYQDGGKDFDLSKESEISSALQNFNLSTFQSNACITLLLSLGVSSRDEMMKFIKVYSDAEKNLIVMDRLLLSGHSGGITIFGTTNGNVSIPFTVFHSLKQIFPIASGQVKHLMLSACNTGQEEKMLDYVLMFPNLETIWAYDGSSPSGKTAEAHIQSWSISTLSRRVKSLGSKGGNIATWSKTQGFNGQRLLPLSQAISDVESDESTFQDYFLGKNEVTNTSFGFMRNYYQKLQSLSFRSDLPASQKQKWQPRLEVAKRILFYNEIKKHFNQTHKDQLLADYQKLGHTQAPDYSLLSRKDSLLNIDLFNAEVISKNLNNLKSNELLNNGLKNLDSTIILEHWI